MSPFGADAPVNPSHTLASTYTTSPAEHGHVSVKLASGANVHTAPSHSPPATPATKLSLKDRLAAKRSVIPVPASGVD